MRIHRSELHSSIFQAKDQFTARMSTAVGADAKDQAAYQQYLNKLFVTTGPMPWIKFFGFLIGFVLIAAEVRVNRLFLPVLFAYLGLGIYISIRSFIHQKDSLGIESLEVLAPRLDLTPDARTYLQAVLALYRTSAIDSNTRSEILAQLSRLMDERVRLADAIDPLRKMATANDRNEAIHADVARLELAVSTTSDAIARETYQTSLELAQARLAKLNGATPVKERIEAQIALIDQTLAGFADTLARINDPGDASNPSDLGTLRNRVAQIHAQSQSLESATNEIRELLN